MTYMDICKTELKEDENYENGKYNGKVYNSVENIANIAKKLAQ